MANPSAAKRSDTLRQGKYRMHNPTTVRGGGDPAEVSSPSFRQFFTTESLFTQVPDQVEDLFEAAGLSDGTFRTWLRLLRYARASVRNLLVGDTGMVRVFPSPERLARERGTTERTIRRHLEELHDAGILQWDRGSRGKNPDLWMKPLDMVSETLMGDDHVFAELVRRFPDRYGTGVTSLPDFADKNDHQVVDKNVHPRRRNTMKKSTGSAPAAAGPPAEVHDRLAAAAAGAAEKTSKAKERRESKPKSQRMGGGQKRAKSEDSAKTLLEYLNERNTDQLGSTYPVPATVENLSKLRQLLDRYGPEQVNEVLTKLTERATWKLFKAKKRAEVGAPTPGFLLAWSETIWDFVLNQNAGEPQAKRSGGAEVVEEKRAVVHNPFGGSFRP